MDEKRVPIVCPFCGELVPTETLIRVEGRRQIPRAGDVLVCGACGEISVMGKSGKAEKPTPQELAEIWRDHLSALDAAENAAAKFHLAHEA
jgi:hypothetical protein